MYLQVSIYAAPEKWLQTHYALEVAVKMLDFYEEYFNIRYPLPKQGKKKKITKQQNIIFSIDFFDNPLLIPSLSVSWPVFSLSQIW